MYGKVFDSMYDGTLRVCWQAVAIFPHLIVLADDDGIVDMTAVAIHGRTGIPLEIIDPGIEFLEQPDPHSRTPTMDGRRIERLDAHRPWGWRIVNYQKYRDMATRADKKRADRERIAAKRAAEHDAGKHNNGAGVARCREVSPGVANVAHTDTDTDVSNTTAREGIPDDWKPGPTQTEYALRFLVPPDQIETITENFRAHYQSTAARSRNNFDDEWRKWITGPITQDWIAKQRRANNRLNETPGAERTSSSISDAEIKRQAKPGESWEAARTRLLQCGGG